MKKTEIHRIFIDGEIETFIFFPGLDRKIYFESSDISKFIRRYSSTSYEEFKVFQKMITISNKPGYFGTDVISEKNLTTFLKNIDCRPPLETLKKILMDEIFLVCITPEKPIHRNDWGYETRREYEEDAWTFSELKNLYRCTSLFEKARVVLNHQLSRGEEDLDKLRLPESVRRHCKKYANHDRSIVVLLPPPRRISENDGKPRIHESVQLTLHRLIRKSEIKREFYKSDGQLEHKIPNVMKFLRYADSVTIECIEKHYYDVTANLSFIGRLFDIRDMNYLCVVDGLRKSPDGLILSDCKSYLDNLQYPLLDFPARDAMEFHVQAVRKLYIVYSREAHFIRWLLFALYDRSWTSTWVLSRERKEALKEYIAAMGGSIDNLVEVSKTLKLNSTREDLIRAVVKITTSPDEN